MRAAPKMLPKATPVEEPLLARRGAVGDAVPLPADPVDGAGIGTVAIVVSAGTPEFSETGVVSAGTEAGVPTTRTGTAAVAVPSDGASVGVENVTCGTVMTVEIIVVVDEDGITSPEETPVDSTHGTVTVVWIEMVVTGMLSIGASGAGVTLGADGDSTDEAPGISTDGAAVTPGPSTDETEETPGTSTDGAEDGTDGGETPGQAVMIAGF